MTSSTQDMKAFQEKIRWMSWVWRVSFSGMMRRVRGGTDEEEGEEEAGLPGVESGGVGESWLA